MQEISVVVTMDCEPTKATTHADATGPVDFAQSERAILGYFEIAKSYGFPVTFFVHPETILHQNAMFKELARQGACIGLHMHPWKYSVFRYGGKRFLAHYGELGARDQLALLSEASALWHEGMGERPLYFRPGTFSANDSTYDVLEKLGFRGGSASAPGRVFREIYAVWTGAEPDPHRAHAHFRQVAGDLQFANMPLSADFSRLLTDKRGRQRHADFRPDIDWQALYDISYRTIAQNIVRQTLERAPSVPCLSTISHNHFEYRDRSAAPCQRFVAMLDAISEACHDAGVKPVGATNANIVDRVLALDPVRRDFAYI